MTRSIVYFVEQTERFTPIQSDQYEFRPDKRFKWLQRACLYILRSIGANAETYSRTIERIPVEPDKFIDRLLHTQSYLIQHNHGVLPDMVLIGADDYSTLMSCTTISESFKFKTEYGFNRSIMGLDVIVVPWMKGVLALNRSML